MGNAFEICIQVDRPSEIIAALEETNDEQHYSIEEFTNTDPRFLAEIEAFKKEKGFQEFLQGKRLMKHVSREEYYLGCWQGKCKKGKGVSYRAGEYLYYGLFDSVPHGRGQLKLYHQNITVNGQLVKGKPVGICTIKQLSGAFNFNGILNEHSLPQSGQFQVNDQQHPERSYVIHLNNYPEQKAKIVYKDMTEYEGEVNFATLLPEGKGKAQYANLTSYSGDWIKGEYHGYGKYQWSDGSRYEGNYIHGIKSGQGTYHYVSGKVYQGQWAHGKQEGYGILYSPNNEILKQGNWKAGVYIKADI